MEIESCSTTTAASATLLHMRHSGSFSSSSVPPSFLAPPHLAPNTEFEVSSSSNLATPTASPLTARHYTKFAANPAPTPSPDSAIHSAYYSPSQSPVQSRHIGGGGQMGGGGAVGGPLAGVRTGTPSLSRNNSDASQYGGSQYSYSSNSATSPLSPAQFSPTHSPVQGRHLQQQHSSPLPPVRHLSLPPNYLGSGMAQTLSRERSSPISEVEQHPGDMTTHQQQQQAAGGGISRQQLINR